MDLGAGNSVIPRCMVIDKTNIGESAGSTAGAHYVAGTPNEGKCDMRFHTNEGHAEESTFQIAEATKALGAVSHLVDNGYRVVFEKDMKTGNDTSMMVNKNNIVATRFRRERNVWVLDAYVSVEGNIHTKQAFHRRG